MEDIKKHILMLVDKIASLNPAGYLDGSGVSDSYEVRTKALNESLKILCRCLSDLKYFESR